MYHSVCKEQKGQDIELWRAQGTARRPSLSAILISAAASRHRMDSRKRSTLVPTKPAESYSMLRMVVKVYTLFDSDALLLERVLNLLVALLERYYREPLTPAFLKHGFAQKRFLLVQQEYGYRGDYLLPLCSWGLVVL